MNNDKHDRSQRERKYKVREEVITPTNSHNSTTYIHTQSHFRFLFISHFPSSSFPSGLHSRQFNTAEYMSSNSFAFAVSGRGCHSNSGLKDILKKNIPLIKQKFKQ